MTADLKSMIMEALSDRGGVKYLIKIADQEPRAFITLVAKLLPTNVVGDINVNMSIAERLERAKQRLLGDEN